MAEEQNTCPITAVFDVLQGRRSAVSHIADYTGLDVRTIIRVLQAIETVPLPLPCYKYLISKGFEQDQVSVAHIGMKRIACSLILQHIGLREVQGSGIADETVGAADGRSSDENPSV